ncbi:unnamed protein product [Closterium sp. NIES-53]
MQQVLQRFGFTYSSPQSTPLPTGHSLSAPPSDKSVEPSGPYPELVGCLITSGMGLVLGGRARVVLTGHADASWVDDLATQRSSQGYTFNLGSGSVYWRSTRSSSFLSSSCEAEIYARAMAAQELRWLTYLLTDLGEAPRSPPVLYVDNKAMLALCQDHRLEHRTKHIALCYFLARELQQRGQLRLAYVASQANTVDVFTKALQPSCFVFLDWSCDLLFSPTLPMGVLQSCLTIASTDSSPAHVEFEYSDTLCGSSWRDDCIRLHSVIHAASSAAYTPPTSPPPPPSSRRLLPLANSPPLQPPTAAAVPGPSLSNQALLAASVRFLTFDEHGHCGGFGDFLVGVV